MRVGCVLERVVVLGELALFDLSDLLSDLDQRCDEAIELILGLTLRRLYHQRAGDRERQRGCVETKGARARIGRRLR